MSHGPYEHAPKQASKHADKTHDRGREEMVLAIGRPLNKQFDCDMADYKTIESGSHAPAWLMTHLLSWSASVSVMPYTDRKKGEGEEKSPPKFRGGGNRPRFHRTK